jgi:hypothetical protein
MGLWVVLAMVDLGLLLVLDLDLLLVLALDLLLVLDLDLLLVIRVVLDLDCLDCLLGRIHLLRPGATDYLVIRFIMRL